VESLRGVAALAIAGYHISGAVLHGAVLFTNVPWNRIATPQDALGRFGLALLPAHAALMIFFVISGFVLRISLEHGPQRFPAATAKFVLARLFRIYPIVFFAVILAALLSQSPLHSPGQDARPLTAPLLFANLFLFDASLNSTLWALQVELLMVPVILLLYFVERKRGPYALLGVALATTALAFWSGWAVWPPLSTNVFPFVLGMVIPTLGRRFAVHWSKRAAIGWTLGVAALLFLTAPCLGLYARATAVIEAYAAAALVSLAAYRLDVSVLRWLDVKPLRLLGLSSGSYYVLHMATIPAALAIAGAIIPPAWSADFPALVGFLVIPAWLVAVAPLALCGFYLIEARGVALGRRVARFFRLDARRSPWLASQAGAQRTAA
jgi:peptidoglycan/LPS O-acetylase OafA/YrhL